MLPCFFGLPAVTYFDKFMQHKFQLNCPLSSQVFWQATFKWAQQYHCNFQIVQILLSRMNSLHWWTRTGPGVWEKSSWIVFRELFGVYHRVAEVARAREQRSPKGQGLLRKEGPPTYAVLSRNWVMSRFTHFLKGIHRAFNESHPAFVDLSTKTILLS